MKTKYLLSILLFFLIGSTFGQDVVNSGKRLSVSIALGVGADWFNPRTDGYTSKGARMGFRYGVPLDINLTKGRTYYFSTGLLFNHTGGKLQYLSKEGENNEAASVLSKYMAIYLTIPTAIKLKTPSFGRFVFAGNFGFTHSFCIYNRAKDSYTFSDGGQQEGKKTRINTLVFREGIYIGIGGEFAIKDNFKTFLYINYNHGLTNYFNGKKSSNNITGEKEFASVSNLELMLGVTF